MSESDPSRGGDELPQFDPFAPVDYPADYPGPPGYPPLPPPAYPGASPPPGGYPYPPYHPYGPAIPPGTSGKAIASLVCGLVGVALCVCFLPSLAAVVLGVIAMSETKRTGQSGYPLAVAGLTLGVVTLLIGLFFTVVTLVSA
jgi:Domain of unknown function (DUF4190)